MAEYYVATNGNDGANGSLDAPWRTINRGANALSPGDTLYVRGGEYRERVIISSSGSIDAPITVRNYAAESPAIDGGGVSIPTYGGLLDITGHNVVVDGLTVRNVPVSSLRTRRGVRVYGSTANRVRNVVIRNCTIHDIEEIGLLFFAADGCVADNCRGYNLDMYFHPSVRPNGDWGGGFVMSGRAINCAIKNCEVSDCWGEAIIIDKGSDNCVIEGNTVYAHWAPVYIHRSTNCAIRGNFIYGIVMADNVLSRGIAIGNELATYNLGYGVTRYTVIENNIVVGCNIGIDGDAWDISESFQDLVIRHNTIVNCRSGLTIGARGGNTGVVENNLFYGNTTQVAYCAGLDFRNNAWTSNPGEGYWSAGDVVGDPDMVNPNAAFDRGTGNPDNYRLNASSPCIDAAYPSNLATDFWGNERG